MSGWMVAAYAKKKKWIIKGNYFLKPSEFWYLLLTVCRMLLVFLVRLELRKIPVTDCSE